MQGKLKIGIIGCGGIANGKHMPSLAKLASVEMVAFCDIIVERAQAAAEKYGAAGARVYADYKELLAQEDVDVVHVCTPNSSHAEITIASLEAGCHVNCEKPMAKTAQEARAMAEAAERTGKKLTIAYQNRFRRDSQYLKALCERGDLGEIYYAKATALRRRAVPHGAYFWTKSSKGRTLIDIGTHALDLTLWMMDNYRPRYCGAQSITAEQAENAKCLGPWDPEKFQVEDSAFGFIVMEDGATIVLESSWALNTLLEGEARTILHGTEGGADMEDGLRINGEEFSTLYTKKPVLDAGGVAFYEGESESPADLEMRCWIESILNDTEPLVVPEQALVVTEILEGIYKSAQLGQPVYFKDGRLLD